MGARHPPHSARFCELTLHSVGMAGRLPAEGTSCLLEGHQGLGAHPPPAARSRSRQSGPAAHILWVRVCRCGDLAFAIWLALGSIQGPQRNALHLWHAPPAHPRDERRWQHTPSRTSAGGSTGTTDSGLPGHPARPRRKVPIAHHGRGPPDRLARQRQTRGIPTPC